MPSGLSASKTISPFKGGSAHVLLGKRHTGGGKPFQTGAIKEAARFKDVKADPDTTRMLYLLRVASPLAAPSESEVR